MAGSARRVADHPGGGLRPARSGDGLQPGGAQGAGPRWRRWPPTPAASRRDGRRWSWRWPRRWACSGWADCAGPWRACAAVSWAGRRPSCGRTLRACPRCWPRSTGAGELSTGAAGRGRSRTATSSTWTRPRDERLRQRLSELLAELTPGDTRVARAALEACTEPAFPLAALQEARALPVEWHNVRRLVLVSGRDLTGMKAGDLADLLGGLASPEMREDGTLYLALPGDVEAQTRAWQAATAGLQGRFVPALLAWLPRPLTRDGAGPPGRARGPRPHGRGPDAGDAARGRCAGEAAGAPARLHRGGEPTASARLPRRPDRRRDGARRWWRPSVWPASWAIGRACSSAAFAAPFDRLFPRFPEIAPARRLSGRSQTNQIIDEFIRPGQVQLPPASALRGPPARVRGAARAWRRRRARGFRLVLQQPDLVQAALAAAPERGEEITPDSVIAFGAWAGRLGKGEWGLAREQLELLAAALLRTGHLIPLDAFLQPLRFEAVAAPLGEFLPYVMRALPLPEPEAGAVRALWSAATGRTETAWTLPAQEQAWRELLAWAGVAARHRAENVDEAVARAWRLTSATTRRPGAGAGLPRGGGGPDRDAGRGASLAGGTGATGGGRCALAGRCGRHGGGGGALARGRGLPARPSARPDRRLPPPHRPATHLPRAGPARLLAPGGTRALRRAGGDGGRSAARCGRPPPPSWRPTVATTWPGTNAPTPRRASTPCSKRAAAPRWRWCGVSPGPAWEVTPRRGWRASSAAPWGGAATRATRFPWGMWCVPCAASPSARRSSCRRPRRWPARRRPCARSSGRNWLPRATSSCGARAGSRGSRRRWRSLLAEPPSTAQEEAEALTEEVIAWIRDHRARAGRDAAAVGRARGAFGGPGGDAGRGAAGGRGVARAGRE